MNRRADISAGDFAAAMQACLDAAGRARGSDIAVAVSGGGDSMALAVLLHDWAKERGLRMKAYTVDHGLRAESAAEAQKVQDVLSGIGIAHDVLRWHGEKPSSGIQEEARMARYRLLAEACGRDGFSVLAVAHNREDQVETFWMRLIGGSGLDGLSGMAPARALPSGVTLLRPLLDFSRAQLRDVCRARDVAWVEDPSNENQRFLRVRLRAFEELLAAEGLSPQRLSQTVGKLAQAREALDHVTAQVLAAAVTWHEAGYAVIDTQMLAPWPQDIRHRAVLRVLQGFAPQDYRPSYDAAGALAQDILQPDFSGRTLAGCGWFPAGAGKVIVCREEEAMAPRQPLGAGILWDGRFGIAGDDAVAGLEIGGLTAAGVSILRKRLPESSAPSRFFEALPGKVRPVLPVIWQGENLVAVPCLSWVAPEGAAAAGGLRLRFAPAKIV